MAMAGFEPVSPQMAFFQLNHMALWSFYAPPGLIINILIYKENPLRELQEQDLNL